MPDLRSTAARKLPKHASTPTKRHGLKPQADATAAVLAAADGERRRGFGRMPRLPRISQGPFNVASMIAAAKRWGRRPDPSDRHTRTGNSPRHRERGYPQNDESGPFTVRSLVPAETITRQQTLEHRRSLDPLQLQGLVHRRQTEFISLNGPVRVAEHGAAHFPQQRQQPATGHVLRMEFGVQALTARGRLENPARLAPLLPRQVPLTEALGGRYRSDLERATKRPVGSFSGSIVPPAGHGAATARQGGRPVDVISATPIAELDPWSP